MNNQPILFVSGRCPNSTKIMETLKAMNKENLCRLYSIDGKTRQQLPDFLKSVPTLYVPDSKDVYVGKDIYGYIAKPVQSRREVPVATPAQQAAATPQTGPADYSPWSFEGAGSLTESYSSWDQPGQFTGEQLMYSFLGGSSATPPAGAPEPQTKQSYDGAKQGRNDDLSARMEAYKKTRESEFKGVSRQ